MNPTIQLTLTTNGMGNLNLLSHALSEQKIVFSNSGIKKPPTRSGGIPGLEICLVALYPVVGIVMGYLFHATSPANASVTLSAGEKKVTVHAGHSESEAERMMTQFFSGLESRVEPK